MAASTPARIKSKVRPKGRPQGEEHRGDRGMQGRAAAVTGRRESAQKSVGAPPSALRRATKAVSASEHSASRGGEPEIRFPERRWTAAPKQFAASHVLTQSAHLGARQNGT